MYVQYQPIMYVQEITWIIQSAMERERQRDL